MDAVLYGLEHAELPDLRQKIQNGDGNARKIQERLIAKLEKQMDEYREQEENQYDLLETRQYTPEVFARRNAQLRQKMEETETAIYKARSELPKNVDYAEREVALLDAIRALKDPDMTPAEKNKLLKAIVERIEYTGPPSGSDHAKRGVTPFTLEFVLRF
jgi:DNA repair exonuclease SbcCD ATPase subunit